MFKSKLNMGFSFELKGWSSRGKKTMWTQKRDNELLERTTESLKYATEAHICMLYTQILLVEWHILLFLANI